MNLSAPFIKRPVMTTLVMCALTIFGVFSYKLIPVASLPSIQYPTIVVTANYPGASPDETARLVAAPLERQFILMQGIDVVSSSSTYQNTSIVLQFHMNVDIDVAASEVQEAINAAMAQLPADLPSNPTYTKANPSDTPILYLVMTSKTMPQSTMYEWAYNYLGQQIGTVEGVAQIQTYGFPYAVRVQVDPGKLASRNISLDTLAQRINENNPDEPTGKFYGSFQSITTQTDGQITSAEGYNNLIIKYDDKGPVRLRDVATAYDSVENDKQKFRWETRDGTEEVVILAVNRIPQYNTVEVTNNILALVERLQSDLPSSIKLSVPYAQEKWINQSVFDVEFTLLIAFFLVIAVVFFYLGKLRNSVIPLITLPITLTGTLIFMYFAGYSLDILSLSAFTISIGFLVDDAIVVLENAVRWIQKGYDPIEGTLKASRQIATTILSISLCLCAVFLPMLFLREITGQILHEFAGVVIIAVLFSGCISLSLTPMLCSRFIPSSTKETHSRMERFSLRLNEYMIKAYKKPLWWMLTHKYTSLTLAIASVAASLIAFRLIPTSFLPPNDLGIVQGFIQADEGTSPEMMERYLDQLSKVAMKNPYISSLGRISGYPADNQGLLIINLVDEEKRPPIWPIMRDLQSAFYQEVIGANAYLKALPLINLQVGGTAAATANYQYTLTSFNEELLYESAEKFLKKLKANPYVSNVNSDMQTNGPYLKVKLLRDQAQTYSRITATTIENAFKYAYGETYVSRMNLPVNMYYVILELQDSFAKHPDELDKLYIVQDGEPIAIKNVIDTEEITGPSTVSHINTLNSVTVSFDTAPGVPLSTAIDSLKKEAEMLPEDIEGQIAGNAAAFEDSGGELLILLILAIFVIYLILGILYENFLQPITPLSAIPVAIFGGLITLILFNETLSVYAFIGLIMLIGIVMKNGILIVDFALEYQETERCTPLQAIYEASIVRFRPILMTTLAAMMGALPIALGIGGTVAKGRAPLGMVIVGGLIISQAVTLFITPVIFLFVSQMQRFIQSKTRFFDHTKQD